MAKNILVINVDVRETRVALIENGIIAELHIERESSKGTLGNIYLGKVSRVLPGMQAAFIDVGLERAAFLHVEDLIRPDDFDEYLAGGRSARKVRWRSKPGGREEVTEATRPQRLPTPQARRGRCGLEWRWTRGRRRSKGTTIIEPNGSELRRRWLRRELIEAAPSSSLVAVARHAIVLPDGPMIRDTPVSGTAGAALTHDEEASAERHHDRSTRARRGAGRGTRRPRAARTSERVARRASRSRLRARRTSGATSRLPSPAREPSLRRRPSRIVTRGADEEDDEHDDPDPTRMT
jgi:Ribonuclease G/E